MPMTSEKSFPRRPESHQLEELSRRFFVQSLPKNWAADRPQNDYGVDVRVDLFDDDRATGLELLVQLKSSADSDGADSETIRLRTTTFNYLKDKLQVVMLVKFVQSENEAYWVLLRDVASPSDANQETMAVHLPKGNRLSSIPWQEVRAHIKRVTDTKLAAARAVEQQLHAQERSASRRPE